MKRQTQFSLWYFALAFLAVVLLRDVWVGVRTVAPIPYSEFQTLVRAGKVAEIAIADNRIEGTLKEARADGKTRFVTTRVEPDLAADLAQYDVKFSGVVESTFLRDLLGWVVPAVVLVAVWVFVMRRFADKLGGGGFMSLGKSKARVYVETDTKVDFADVAGVDEAKAELAEIVGFLKDPQSFGRLGGRPPKGVLLVGPPGTGKTLLARAVAGEAGVAFFSISGSEFVEMFVGVGAARVRDLFEQARAKAPAIIFIDELDALGRTRGAGAIGGHDEKDQTLNQLLVELDGFDGSKGLVLLGATNRPEVLDPALLRAGRFDRQVVVDRPDKAGRVAILAVHMRKIRLAPGVDTAAIADLTPGFTGAELANLCNEAALAATRRNADAVGLDDFTVAVERIVAGPEKKSRVLSPKEREVVAHHEMGHALVAMASPGADPVHKVSIIPRGVGALGYTIQRPTEERYLTSRAELEGRMAVLLGGRAAEEVVFGHFSTGAADDLQRVTSIARAIVARFGMHGELGHVVYETERPTFLGTSMPLPGEKPYSETTAREIDLAVREIVMASYRRALDLLRAREAVLRSAASELLQKETLGTAELERIRQAAAAPVTLLPQAA